MSYLWFRRASQLAVLAIFVFLFLNTEYKDNDILPYAVNIFLRLDPLVALATSLAAKALITLVWPALPVVLATLIFGRFFCGWVCPLGTFLDFTSWLLGRRRYHGEMPRKLYRFKYLLLAALLAASLFGLQLVYLFDPISLLIRSLAVAVFPATNLAINGLFDQLYRTDIGAITAVSEPAYAVLRNHFLAFEQPFFQTAFVTGTIFFSILALEYFARRFWCRYLCPLGALFGLIGRFGAIRRRLASADCSGCRRCRTECRMDAIDENFATTAHQECIVCLDCEALCPEKIVHFSHHGESTAADLDLSRRGLLRAAGLGLLSVPLMGVEASAKTGNPGRIRPPGALAEAEFLARCTRCGECMRVCIANGLQPALFEAGVAGVWSPVLVSRIGYCEYNCTLCGQVCPTGAISELQVEKKQEVRIGLAEVDRGRCLPWKGDSECIVCEEHCPTPEKAIRLREEPVYSVVSGQVEMLKRPYVDEKLCIGCGICENKCPLSDRAAIIITSRGETRAGDPATGYSY